MKVVAEEGNMWSVMDEVFPHRERRAPRSYHAQKVSGMGVAPKVVKMIVVSLSYCHVANA